MRFIIKKMDTDAEIRGKAYVHWKSWQEAYSGIVDPHYLEERTLAKCEEMAYRSIDNVIIAKEGDCVVGFVQYGKSTDEDLQNTGEIIALYILADYYRQGIGRRMMQEAHNQLKNYPRIAVWVLKDNERAIAFYQQAGYHLDGHIGMTQIGATAVRMIVER